MLDFLVVTGGSQKTGWNFLGILLVVAIILYLVFIVQNIRQRRIKMIIKEHKRFTWKNTLLSLVEVAAFLVASVWMFNNVFLDNPDLEDSSRITSSVEYRPLVLETGGSGNSSYVTIDSAKKKVGSQEYTFYIDGQKYKVPGTQASVAFGPKVLDVSAEKIPYNDKVLAKKDQQYQKAYVAIYTAVYKKNWQNGLGFHAGRVATKYYLIRIPDGSFIKYK